MLGGRWRFIRYFSLAPFAPLCRGHQGTMFAFGREHTMEPGKIDSGPGHQRGHARNEIQRLEHHMRGACPVRRLQLVANVAA